MRPEDAVVTAPACGAPYGIGFDGRVRWVWWGQDAAGDGRAGAHGHHLLTWDSPAACLSAAESAGWTLDPDGDRDRSGEVLDLQPAQDWLARRAVRLDTAAGLNLWNWALDAATSTRRRWNPRGHVVDACYRKLVATQVPHVFDLDSYRPQWSPRQANTLRHILGSAVHTIRTAHDGSSRARSA